MRPAGRYTVGAHEVLAEILEEVIICQSLCAYIGLRT